jgi:hypothetical protein
LESHQSDGKQLVYESFRRDPLKKLSQNVVKKNYWCFQRFEHLPSESLIHFEREIDLTKAALGREAIGWHIINLWLLPEISIKNIIGKTFMKTHFSSLKNRPVTL